MADELYRPSNGTEGDMFIARFCDRCRLSPDNGGACDRVFRSMLHAKTDPEYPQEWRCRFDPDGFDFWCTAYVPLGTGGGDDGESVPVARAA